MDVTIRPLKISDAYVSYRWRNDQDVFSLTTAKYEREITLEMELNWLNRILSNTNDYRCAIEVDGHYVGNIYLTGIDGIKAEYHIFIGDKLYWGKGVAQEASKQILTYAFETLKLDNVFLRVKSENVKAIHLYQKLGFVKIREEIGVDIMEIISERYYTICKKDQK